MVNTLSEFNCGGYHGIVDPWSVSCQTKTFRVNNHGIKLYARYDEGLKRVIFDPEKFTVEVVIATPIVPSQMPRIVDLSEGKTFFEELRNNLEEILIEGEYPKVTPNEDRTIFEVE